MQNAEERHLRRLGRPEFMIRLGNNLLSGGQCPLGSFSDKFILLGCEGLRCTVPRYPKNVILFGCAGGALSLTKPQAAEQAYICSQCLPSKNIQRSLTVDNPATTDTPWHLPDCPFACLHASRNETKQQCQPACINSKWCRSKQVFLVCIGNISTCSYIATFSLLGAWRNRSEGIIRQDRKFIGKECSFQKNSNPARTIRPATTHWSRQAPCRDARCRKHVEVSIHDSECGRKELIWGSSFVISNSYTSLILQYTSMIFHKSLEFQVFEFLRHENKLS